MGLYGLTVAGMATGVGVPVLMAANVGTILSDDNLTFDQDKHDEKKAKLNKKGKPKGDKKRILQNLENTFQFLMIKTAFQKYPH